MRGINPYTHRTNAIHKGTTKMCGGSERTHNTNHRDDNTHSPRDRFGKHHLSVTKSAEPRKYERRGHDGACDCLERDVGKPLDEDSQKILLKRTIEDLHDEQAENFEPKRAGSKGCNPTCDDDLDDHRNRRLRFGLGRGRVAATV